MSKSTKTSANGSYNAMVQRTGVSFDQKKIGELAGMDGHRPHLEFENAYVRSVTEAAQAYVQAGLEIPADPQELFDGSGPAHKKNIVESLKSVLADANFREAGKVRLPVHGGDKSLKWKAVAAFLTDPAICGVTDLPALMVENLSPVGREDAKTTKPSA